MSNEGRADGNMFNIVTDPDIVKDWKDAFEPKDKIFEPKKKEENISFERPDVEAIIATQPAIVLEEDPPAESYTGICSMCNRPERGLCPCGYNEGVNFDPKGVNIELAIRPFDESNELVSG